MTTADGTVFGATQILDNGPSGSRWNLVLLAEGYRQQELGQFASAAEVVRDSLLATAPFDELEAAINVFRVDIASTDSGADDPVACGGPGTTAETFLDASFCGDGLIRRLLVVDLVTAMQVASDEVPAWHVALVIVNSWEFGGSGGIPGGRVAVFSLRHLNEAVHEIGHAGFNLADEYDFYVGCDSGEKDRDRHPGGAPLEPNITANADRATLKWRDLVLPSTTTPTTENANCAQCDPQPSPVPAGTVGAFEGAGSFHCGLYRPEFDCRMRNFAQPFCAVCRRHIIQELQPYLPLRTPMNYTVISRIRQHFGEDPNFLTGAFVGQRKDFTFDCPGIDTSKEAVLMFQALHVTHPRNVFLINDETVFGDLPTTTNVDDEEAWAGQVLLVSANVLRPADNVLHIEARTTSGGTSGNLDDFVIDNVVLFYKTHTRPDALSGDDDVLARQ
jgi:IgA Peptidase M64